jgi:hypothetical protein
MDGHRQDNPLTDASLDREIASLVGVEPSPEFVARVRARVAEAPLPRGWWTRWEFGVAVAAVAMIAVVVVWRSQSATPLDAGDVPAQLALERQTAPVVPVVPPAAAVTQQVARDVVSRPRRVQRDERAAERTIPVAVVAKEDARAFELLLSVIRQDALVFDADMPNSALSVSTLAVAPITIEPVPVPEPLEGGVE